MKETHYAVRLPKHKLDCGKTKFFSTLKNAEKFIDKELATVKKWYGPNGFSRDDGQNVIKQFSQIKPIPFEVEFPDFN